MLGYESLDARFMQDDYLLTDLLKRRGPEGFVKEMEARVARLASEHRTLPSVCAEHAEGVEPLDHADLNGSDHQMEIMASLAASPLEKRAVLVMGPTRTGKSHVGDQLFSALPRGSVGIW